MKKNKVLVITIVILSVIIVVMGIKMFMMNLDYQNQKNTLEATEHEITVIIEQIKKRCPDKFNFVD